MYILGVRVDNLNHKEVLEKIDFFLSEEKFHHICTINPEFILEAQRDEEFKNILNSSDLNIADGVGIKLAFWKRGERLKERIAGADLTEEILKIASEKNIPIFLAINERGLSSYEETKSAILKKYPNLQISGENIRSLGLARDDTKRAWDIHTGILFCNFGAPRQEKFIYNQKNDNIRLAVGVGGSFDYLTGKVPRAPKSMRLAGLEWLWRLFRQPKRLPRIFRAVIVFPFRLFFTK